jgi:HAD superfamily hydrolase (TIGR01509 family)
MIEAVLFEFDGVLADTHDARRRALLDTLEEDGVIVDDADYADWCASLPVRAAVRTALARSGVPADDTRVDLTAARADRKFRALLESGLSLIPGARALVDSMQGQARLGLVSRAARRDIEHALGLAQLDYAFEFVISDDDPFAAKPSPEPYLAALERLARRRPVSGAHVVALEDSIAGVRSAKAAGLRCAVVGTLPVHLAVNADALIPSLAGLTAASIDALTLGKRPAER